ncbi:MAG TPA: hemolysin III family protein [Desulfuromonadales bacterium]|nr:hemolysin III family protein [Desulfuromonadales bacterium]
MDQRFYKTVQIANTVAPAIGFALSIPGLVVLIRRAAGNGDGWDVVSFAIYGSSLVISYAIFTLYHIFKFHKRLGHVFKILDHSTIYLLIAGTYTPITLVSLRGNGGWILFGAVWGLTVCGILFKVFFVHRFKILAPLIYLFMGWLIIFAIKPAIALIPPGGLRLLLAGGVFYSLGLIFYAWKRLLFHHAIWHLFVLAGSLCHYFAVCDHLLPHVMA